MGWTPLSIAVGLKHEEFAVRILLYNQDFGIKRIDLYGDYTTTTITHEAARHGLNRVLEKMLDAGADVNGPEGCQPSPLYWAVREGQLETCQILLNHQANPETVLRFSGTPLSVAIRTRNKELSCLLVQNRAKETTHSPTPLRANVYNALWPSSLYEEEDRHADLLFEKISSKKHGDFIRTYNIQVSYSLSVCDSIHTNIKKKP